MNIEARAFWNEKKYGESINLHKNTKKSMLISLGFIVPVIIPLPVVIGLSCFIKGHSRIPINCKLKTHINCIITKVDTIINTLKIDKVFKKVYPPIL